MNDVIGFVMLQVHGGGHHKSDEGMDASLMEFLTFIEQLLSKSPSEAFAQLMPGMVVMENWHPLVVHFPIAFLIAFWLVDCVGVILKSEAWRKLASGLLYLGTASAALAVFAGLQAEETVQHGGNVHEIMEQHESLGIAVLVISLGLSLWRFLSGGLLSGFANVLFLLAGLVLNGLILLGADLGGLMVYQYGVAVKAVETSQTEYYNEHTHSH
jgi:uncharacterized membrane protein